MLARARHAVFHVTVQKFTKIVTSRRHVSPQKVNALVSCFIQGAGISDFRFESKHAHKDRNREISAVKIRVPRKSCTQSPLAFWSAGGRQERLWGTGILLPQENNSSRYGAANQNT